MDQHLLDLQTQIIQGCLLVVANILEMWQLIIHRIQLRIQQLTQLLTLPKIQPQIPLKIQPQIPLKIQPQIPLKILPKIQILLTIHKMVWIIIKHLHKKFKRQK
jgi:hypothetical protein